MEIEANRSKSYIIPLLSDYLDIHKGLLENTYLYDINYPEHNTPNTTGIFILFKWAYDDPTRVYEQRLLDNPMVIQHYEINENYYMVFVKIPIGIANDVKLIIDGKYSKLHEKSKQIILKYWQQSQSSKLYKILFKVPIYKKELEETIGVVLGEDVELGSALDFHKETFNKIIKSIELK